jgi:hypothetical protein
MRSSLVYEKDTFKGYEEKFERNEKSRLPLQFIHCHSIHYKWRGKISTKMDVYIQPIATLNSRHPHTCQPM